MKVHIWAGISKRGKTGICIFEGTMDGSFYVKILEETLIPFLQKVYPDGHRLMADNDPKHTSNEAKRFLKDQKVTWWRTPAESPDCNPIENLWHELKEYIRRVKKPRTKQELIDGIKEFWDSVTVAKCLKYINHLKKYYQKLYN